METRTRTRTGPRLDSVEPSGLTAAPRRAQVGLALGVLAAVVVGQFAAPLVYPLRLLTVLLHEGGHALMAVVTGGRVVEIVVNAEESGHTLTSGGIPLLILNAGYLGSMLAGLLLTSVPRVARGPTLLAAVLALVALWFIPVFSFGFLYTALVAIGLGLLAAKGSHRLCGLVLRGLGLFIVADAVRDILSDAGQGDAALLAQATWVPALVWTGLWLVAALALLVRAVRRAS
jgi:hypothetical protein